MLSNLKAQQIERSNEPLMSRSLNGLSPSAPYPTLHQNNGKFDALYPTLDDYMGLSLTSEEVAIIERQTNESNAVSLPQNNRVVLGTNSMIAPISSTSLGLMRANVTHGIREVVLCKDKDSKVGMRVQAINKVFVINY
jgi:syntenin-1